jgi:isoleucyl-tRNA synthetase
VLDGGRARVGEAVLDPGEFELRVQPVDEATTRTLSSHSGLVMLDLGLTEDLIREGIARDLVRAVQQRRRELGLEVTDRIRLEVGDRGGDTRARDAIQAHRPWISEQVLARELTVVAPPEGSGWHHAVLSDQVEVPIRITRLPAS